MEILLEMDHPELKELGVTAYGHRHKILKGLSKLNRPASSQCGNATLFDNNEANNLNVHLNSCSLHRKPGGGAGAIDPVTTSVISSVLSSSVSSDKTLLVDLLPSDIDYQSVEEQVHLLLFINDFITLTVFLI